MEDYKIANLIKYGSTKSAREREKEKFSLHPQKIIAVKRFKRHYSSFVPNRCSKILDIGGGCGIWMDLINSELHGLTVHALDISQAMLYERCSNDIKVCGDMEKLPYRDNSFDQVYFFSSLHHVADTHLAMAEAKRVTKQYGKIFLQEPISLKLELMGGDIERIPEDPAEFRFSISHLNRVIESLKLQIDYIYFSGFLERILDSCKTINVSIYKNLWLRRVADQLEDIANRIPLLQKGLSYSHYTTMVLLKIDA